MEHNFRNRQQEQVNISWVNKNFAFTHAITRELPIIFQFGFACLALTTLTATLSHKSSYDDTVQDYDEQTAYNLANDDMMRKPESAMYGIAISTLAIAGMVFITKMATLIYLSTRNIIELNQPKTPEQRIQQGLADDAVVSEYYTVDRNHNDDIVLSVVRFLENVFSPHHEVAKYIQLTARVFLTILVIQNLKQDYNNYQDFDTYADEEYKRLEKGGFCAPGETDEIGYEKTLKELCDAKSFYVGAQKTYKHYVNNSDQIGQFFLEAGVVILGSIALIDVLFRYLRKYTHNAGRSYLLDGILAITKNLMPFLLLAAVSHAYFTDFSVAMTDTVSEYKDIYDDFDKYATNVLYYNNALAEDYAKGYAYQWFLGTVNGQQLENAIAFSTLFLSAAGIDILYEIIKTISLATVGAINLTETFPSEEAQVNKINNARNPNVIENIDTEPRFIGPYFNIGNRRDEIQNTFAYEIFLKIHAFFHNYYSQNFPVSIANFTVLAEVFIAFMIASQLIIFAFSHQDMQSEYIKNYNDYRKNEQEGCNVNNEEKTNCDSVCSYVGMGYSIYDFINKLDDDTATFLLTVPFVVGGLSLVLSPCVARFFPNRNNHDRRPEAEPLIQAL